MAAQRLETQLGGQKGGGKGGQRGGRGAGVGGQRVILACNYSVQSHLCNRRAWTVFLLLTNMGNIVIHSIALH